MPPYLAIAAIVANRFLIWQSDTPIMSFTSQKFGHSKPQEWAEVFYVERGQTAHQCTSFVSIFFPNAKSTAKKVNSAKRIHVHIYSYRNELLPPNFIGVWVHIIGIYRKLRLSHVSSYPSWHRSHGKVAYAGLWVFGEGSETVHGRLRRDSCHE